MSGADATRFESKIERDENDCWNWRGTMYRDGYGQFYAQGRRAAAHRWGYELLVGPIPAGLVLDHLCRNRACVNPDHLEPVTQQVNILRGTGIAAVNAAKTECSNGHPFTVENTLVRPEGRYCRACARDRQRRSYARRKAAA